MTIRSAVALSLILAACGTGEEFGDYVVFNKTDEPIFVYVAERMIRGPIPPDTQGQLPYPNAACLEGPFVARTAAGREVARRLETICRDDMWTVVEDPSPSSS